MKKYKKSLMIILIIAIIISTTLLNSVIATTEEIMPNSEEIQIALLDGNASDSTLMLDANCDGIITTRDAYLILAHSAGRDANITENGLENIKNMVYRD